MSTEFPAARKKVQVIAKVTVIKASGCLSVVLCGTNTIIHATWKCIKLMKG